MKTTANEYMNYWLEKYHGTTIEKVLEEHPEWEEDSRSFYSAYPVTYKQHDEWYEWAIKRVRKDYKLGRKAAEKEFTFAYLNLAPMIK